MTINNKGSGVDTPGPLLFARRRHTPIGVQRLDLIRCGEQGLCLNCSANPHIYAVTSHDQPSGDAAAQNQGGPGNQQRQRGERQQRG
ncbi:MAG: hypothetical protein WBV59_22525, partial [Anaerolineae bacterium]